LRSNDKNLLDDVVKRIKSRFDVIAIILFGSRARGDWGPWSDYDLLIIGNFKLNYLDRIREIMELVDDIPLPIEPHPYTLDEAMNLLRKGVPSIVDALEEGRILYGNERFKALEKLYNELKKKGMRKTYTSIIVP